MAESSNRYNQTLMSNTDSGFDSIQEKFLSEGNLFGMEFREGFVFLEVEGWEQVSFRPYDNVGSIDAGSNSGYSVLEDPDNNDREILYIPRGEERILHVGIGHRPAMIRRYTQYPDGDNTLRKLPEVGTPSSRNGDDYGYISGEESPYDNPTEAEELVIPPNVSVGFDFFNPDANTSHEPVLNVQIRHYTITALEPRNNPDRNAIRKIVQPGSPMPIYPAGGLDQKISYSLGNDWGVQPLSESQVDSIKNGQFRGGN